MSANDAPKRARDDVAAKAADQDTATKAADAADAKRPRNAAAAADNAADNDIAALPLSPATAAALASAADDPSAIFRPDLLTPASRAAAAASFASAKPFPHLVLHDLIGGGGGGGTGGPDNNEGGKKKNGNADATSTTSAPLLRAVREELITHVRATYKETDLFRVFQTGDLANLDALDAEQRAKLPALSALRAALYSEPFRAFVRAATGCGPLDGSRTDLSCNAYAPGGHLLCHDDVIGSRRVSFIVYLTDPDEPWDAAGDGGALELYPLLQAKAGEEEQGAAAAAAATPPSTTTGGGGGGGGGGDTASLPPPSVEPSTLLPPYWNSMALFVVTPGVSYHSVQEVTAPPGKTRLSISGWYHAPKPPPGAESAASLAQLKLAPGADAVRGHAAFVEEDEEEEEEEGEKGREEGEKEGEEEEAAATKAQAAKAGAEKTARDPDCRDLALLARYVAPAYLEPRAWDAVRRKFQADGSVQLYGFLRPEVARAVSRAARAADRRDGLGALAATSAAAPAAGASAQGRLPSDYLVGARGRERDWEPVGPPHKQRYLRFRGEPAAAAAVVAGEQEEQKEEQKEEHDAGALLAALRRDLFGTGAFARLLRRLTSVQMLGCAGEVRRFRPGLDYTVAHYGVLTSDPRLDCVLCFVDDGKDLLGGREDGGAAGPSTSNGGGGGGGASAGPSAAAEAWADGEVGGYEAYVLGDDDDDDDEDKQGGKGEGGKGKGAAEVYRADDGDAGVLNVPAAANCLSLLLRDEGLMRFVKYVSAAAPGSRWDLAMEYLPDEGSSSEEEEEEEEEG